jgi:hypothetical protein
LFSIGCPSGRARREVGDVAGGETLARQRCGGIAGTACTTRRVHAGLRAGAGHPGSRARDTAGHPARRARRRHASIDELSELLEDPGQELRERHLAVGDPAHGGFPQGGHIRPGGDLREDLDERAGDRRRDDLPAAPLDEPAIEQRLDDRRLGG